jgi:protein-tyrosine phosphatase
MNKIPEKVNGNMKVLFVCTGNTCRSPMAELCFARMTGGRIRCASAGVYAFDGEAMSENSLAVLAENSIDGSNFRSQSVTFDLVDSSDWIITMSNSHRQELLMRFPEAAAKCAVLCRFSGGGDIPDPYGQSVAVYRKTYAAIESALKNWMDFFDNK